MNDSKAKKRADRIPYKKEMKTLSNGLDQMLNDSELMIEILEVFSQHNVIPYKIFRDFKIRREYRMLLFQGIKSFDAIEQIANEYFISSKMVESVIYAKAVTRVN